MLTLVGLLMGDRTALDIAGATIRAAITAGTPRTSAERAYVDQTRAAVEEYAAHEGVPLDDPAFLAGALWGSMIHQVLHVRAGGADPTDPDFDAVGVISCMGLAQAALGDLALERAAHG
jgi:hypothetical protein